MENITKKIILAGATGNLGFKIALELLKKKANVTVLVRKSSSKELLNKLESHGAKIIVIDFNNINELTLAFANGDCIVSAVSGLSNVIVDLQSNLLKAALIAKVPRFIPSDFSIDFTKIPIESNRNLGLRQEFAKIIDQTDIKTTSILNGMFTDLLNGEAPTIMKGINRIMFWGNANQLMDYTTIENTATYTAEVALDDSSPRFLKIAGEVSSIKDLQKTATEVYGKNFKLLRLGGLGVLKTMIKLTKFMMKSNTEVYPPWQGMQYMHNMLTGLPKLEPLDNKRYTNIKWTSIKEVLLNNNIDT